jgi:drug/metabolite transporter (DMT)-like permease
MKRIGFLYSIAAAVTWGLVYAFDQRILSDLSPVTLLTIDAILTLIVIIPVFFLQDHHIREIASVPHRDWIFIIVSLVLAVLANFLIYSGIKNVGANLASMIEIAYPLFVTLFCFILFRDKINAWVAVGGGLMIIGAMIIMRLG